MSETIWNVFAVIGIISVGATFGAFIMSLLIIGERNKVQRRRDENQ